MTSRTSSPTVGVTMALSRRDPEAGPVLHRPARTDWMDLVDFALIAYWVSSRWNQHQPYRPNQLASFHFDCVKTRAGLSRSPIKLGCRVSHPMQTLKAPMAMTAIAAKPKLMPGGCFRL